MKPSLCVTWVYGELSFAVCKCYRDQHEWNGWLWCDQAVNRNPFVAVLLWNAEVIPINSVLGVDSYIVVRRWDNVTYWTYVRSVCSVSVTSLWLGVLIKFQRHFSLEFTMTFLRTNACYIINIHDIDAISRTPFLSMDLKFPVYHSPAHIFIYNIEACNLMW